MKLLVFSEYEEKTLLELGGINMPIKIKASNYTMNGWKPYYEYKYGIIFDNGIDVLENIIELLDGKICMDIEHEYPNNNIIYTIYSNNEY